MVVFIVGITLPHHLASVQGGDKLTRAGSIIGTVAYMSPEQVQGKEIDSRSDLFSFGMVLYELLAGRTPFKRNTDVATLQAIVNDEPQPVVRFRKGVPEELQRIVTKLLQKDPALRYPTAAGVTADLRDIDRTGRRAPVNETSRVRVARYAVPITSIVVLIGADSVDLPARFAERFKGIRRHVFWMSMAQIYEYLDNPKGASVYSDSSRIYLETEIEKYPNDFHYQSELGLTYSMLGRHEDAIEYGLRALEILPPSSCHL